MTIKDHQGAVAEKHLRERLNIAAEETRHSFEEVGRDAGVAVNTFAAVMPGSVSGKTNKVAVGICCLPDPVTGDAANNDLEVMSGKVCLRGRPRNRHVDGYAGAGRDRDTVSAGG